MSYEAMKNTTAEKIARECRRRRDLCLHPLSTGYDHAQAKILGSFLSWILEEYGSIVPGKGG